MTTARALAVGLLCLSNLLTACVAVSLPVESLVESKAWSVDEQKNRNVMVGKWLGESRSGHGDLKLSLIERNENGTYRITFRSYKDGKDYEEDVEVGLWGVSGDIYFTIMRGWIINGDFKASDPTRAYFYDAYRVSSLTPMSFEYETVETGMRFTNKRVGDDFQFSD